MIIKPDDKAFWLAYATTGGPNPSHRSLYQFYTREELRAAFSAWLETREWDSSLAFECGVDNEGGG